MIDLLIFELLRRKGRVVVPNLGAFFIKEEQFSNEKESGSFTVLFSDSLRFNDGILISHLKRIEGLSLEEAEKQVEKYVGELQDKLKGGNRHIISNLGYLQLEKDELVFHQTHQPTLDQGLTINEPATVEPATVEPTTVEPLTVEPTTVDPTTVEPTTDNLQPTTDNPQPVIVNPQPLTRNPKPTLTILLLLVVLVALTLGVAWWFDFLPMGEKEILFEPEPVETVAPDAAQNQWFDEKEPAQPADSLLPQSDTLNSATTENVEPELIDTIAFMRENSFHIIAASCNTHDLAKETLEDLHAKGYDQSIIMNQTDGKFRVTYASFSNRAEAIVALEKIRIKENQPDAWLLVYKP